MADNYKYPSQTYPWWPDRDDKDSSANGQKKPDSAGDTSSGNNTPTETKDTTVGDIVTVNGMEYRIRKLDVGLNHVQFITDDLTIHNALDIFKNVDTISLSKSNSTEAYATYENLVFASASISADGAVTVTMTILSYADIKMKESEKLQSNIEDIVSRLIYGEDIRSNGSVVDLAAKVVKHRVGRGEDFDKIIKDYPRMSEHELKFVRERCFGGK